VDAFARDLSTRVPGLIVGSTVGGDDRAAPFVVLERFHLAIAIVTVVASSIFLLALMLMLVDERRETVGILRLVGYRRRRILQYVLAVGLVIAAAGAAIGILIAAAFQSGVNQFFQWRYDTALVFVRITPPIALRSVAIAVPLGVLAAAASSWTLIRREVFSLTRR
jgi:putative ABC transport system permease protein